MGRAAESRVTAAERTRVTLPLRVLPIGGGRIIETASATFLLLIAVRWFNAGAFARLRRRRSGLGYLVTPVVVAMVENARIPVAQAAARLAAGGAVALAVAAVVPWEPVYVLTAMLAMASAGALVPLLTQIYQDNYPDATRGRFFSRTFMIRILSAAVFSFVGGALLALDIGYFRLLLLIFTASMAFAAWCLTGSRRRRSRPQAAAIRFARSIRPRRPHVPDHARVVDADGLCQPDDAAAARRVPRQSALSPRARPDVIALLTGIVPNLARLVLSPIWVGCSIAPTSSSSASL
jgi:hypothetical protein